MSGSSPAFVADFPRALQRSASLSSLRRFFSCRSSSFRLFSNPVLWRLDKLNYPSKIMYRCQNKLFQPDLQAYGDKTFLFE
jgi:hypothetical protein